MNDKNKSNNQIDNPIFLEIIKILNLDDKQVSELLIKEKKEGFSSVISGILRKNSINKKLVKFLLKEYNGNIFHIISSKIDNDKELAILAIKQNMSNYYLLSEVLKKDINIGKTLIESFIREGKNFLELEPIIDKYFDSEKDKKTLLDYYYIYIKKAENIYIDDFSKGMILIQKTNNHFYKYLIDAKIVIGKGKQIVINDDFKKGFINDLLNNKEYNLLNFEEKGKFEKKHLSNFLNINLKNLDSDSLFIFNSILNLCIISSNKQIVKTKREKISKKEEEKGEKEDNNINNTKKDGNNTNDKETNFSNFTNEDKISFCLPSCNYTCSSSGDYLLSINEGVQIKLSEKEITRFTSEGLINFIKFYNMLYDLNINFLWDSNKESFINILNNTIGFSYPDGQGVTESRSLRVLNLIGKSIGLIGFKKSQYQKEFNTLGGAKLAFEEIKSSGIIGDNQYETIGQYANPVKNALKDLGYIGDKGELNTYRFYNTGENIDE